MNRYSRLALPACAAALVAATVPAVAAAQDSPGIEVSASSPGPCLVTFQMDNRTNSTFFTLDFRVDNEPLGPDDFGTGPVGPRSVRSEIAPDTPPWPGNPYRNDIEPPFTSTKTEDLEARGYPPKPPTETYLVEYRVILGPEANDYVEEWQSIEVPGCKETSGGTLDFGSLDFGSLGSLGSMFVPPQLSFSGS